MKMCVQVDISHLFGHNRCLFPDLLIMVTPTPEQRWPVGPVILLSASTTTLLLT
jgi:hypothetical protein